MAIDAPRATLFIIILVFFLLSPDNRNASLSQQRSLADQIANERAALQVLNSSNYNGLDTANQRWLNLTGFREGDGFVWDGLPIVQQRARELFNTIIADSALSVKRNGTSDTESQEMQDALRDVPSSMKPFNDHLPMYSNVTSVVRGQWAHSKITKGYPAAHLNLTNLAPEAGYISQQFNRNITGWSGDLRFKLAEQSTDEELDIDSNVVRKIKAEMIIQDETSSGDGWDITMFGVHYVQQGSIVLSTTSEKFAGIFALPHFTLSTEAFELAQGLLSSSLKSVIDEQEISFDAVLNPWTSSPSNPSDSMFPIPHCEFIVYLQQHPSSNSDEEFRNIEEELRYPTGASLSSTPLVKMSALIFSPDCGFILESKGPPEYSPAEGSHLLGQKIEAYIKTAREFVLTFACLVCAEIFLLKRQMNEASTPSTKSRISFYTIAMMALGDGFACMSFLVAGMFIDTLFLPLIATAFLSFLCVSFFGMKFLMDIYTVQAPERQERERERQRARDQRSPTVGQIHPESNSPSNLPMNSNARNAPATPIDTLPLPATAPRSAVNRPATPIILPPDQDLDATAANENVTTTTNTQTPAPTTGTARRELSALYTKFYFLLLSLLFLSLHSTSWPLGLRTAYTNLLSTIYLSLWLPQIHRNIIRNSRFALSFPFITGQSLLRLIPFIYFYAYPDNILYTRPSIPTILCLCGWVWIQVCVLVAQEVVGPRFFVPEGWAPKAYDYHPVLREGDAESGGNMPIGFTEAMGGASVPTSPVATTSSPIAPTKRSDEDKPKTKRQNGDYKRTFDCAICTETFDVPVIPAISPSSDTATATNAPPPPSAIASSSAAAATTIFARRAYMVTPCRHIFHSGCLEGWMRYRLQCPICREGLPSL